MSRKRGTNSMNLRMDPRRAIDARRHWFVVSAEPGRERSAAREFHGRGITLWLPHFVGITVRRHRTTEVSGLFFPGYLFAGLDPDEHDVKEAAELWSNKHVTDVLGEPKPLRIPDVVLQAIADRLTGNTRSERLSVAAAFRVGEMREVVQGPFHSFMAMVTEVLATGRVKVDVSIFGRATSVEMDPHFLDAA